MSERLSKKDLELLKTLQKEKPDWKDITKAIVLSRLAERQRCIGETERLWERINSDSTLYIAFKQRILIEIKEMEKRLCLEAKANKGREGK